MRLFLAAAMPFYHLYPDLRKSLYTLETFFWLDGKSKEKLDNFFSTINMDNFLLDSGAYSFMNAQRGKKIDFEAYLERYIRFINERGVKYFFELDLDSVVFSYVAFLGVLPDDIIFASVISSFAVKYVISIVATPLAYLNEKATKEEK